MRAVSNQLSRKSNVTSHSCRIGYITHLCKDSKDIEFVKYSMNYRTLETRFDYLKKLSNQEKQNHIS